MTRVTVTLDRVECVGSEHWGGPEFTEDVTGPDDFYLVGAVSDGKSSEGILTEPIRMSNWGDNRSFGPGGGTVFYADVPNDSILKIALRAFDKDAAEDWNDERHALVDKIGTAVSAGLLAIPNPKTALAGVLLPFAIDGVQAILELDRDDQLGSHLQEFKMWSTPNGVYPVAWHCDGGGSNWHSNWNYYIHYTVEKG